MKILMLTDAFPKPFNPNIGFHVYCQCEELFKINKDIFIVCPLTYIPKILGKIPCGKKLKEYANCPKEFMINDLKVLSPKTFKFKNKMKNLDLSYSLYKLKIFKYLKKIIEQEKIEMIYAVGIMQEGRLARELSRMYKIPYVLTEHSNHNTKMSIENPKQKELYRQIMSEAKHSFFVSFKSLEFYQKNIGKLENANVIRNSYRKEKLYPISKTKSEKLKIVSVGSLIERKGFMKKLEVMKNLKEKNIDFQFDIIGSGELENVILEYIRKNNLQDCCSLLGKKTHEETLNLMQKYDVFALVSKEETFGIVYLEALSLGLITIGTIGEGISDIIQNNVNGFLVNYGDNKALENLLIYIKENYSKLNKIKENAVKLSEEYSWENNAKKLIEIISS